MRTFTLILAAAGLALPAASASARDYWVDSHGHRHYTATAHSRHCRYSSGTAGLVAGGVGGAVLGGSVIGGGLAGPLIGAAGGALAGRAIDRSMTAHRRCS